MEYKRFNSCRFCQRLSPFKLAFCFVHARLVRARTFLKGVTYHLTVIDLSNTMIFISKNAQKTVQMYFFDITMCI